MTDSKKLVVITTGGTGGHVYPGLAVAQQLQARGYRVQWIGAETGLENRVVPAHGIQLHRLPVQGVRGKSVIQKTVASIKLVAAVLKAIFLLLRLRPALVVGLGGYVAGPAGFAAWLTRRPLLIHEQNGVAGTTNRMLAPLATRIVAGFDNAFDEEHEVHVTGNPVRQDLVEAGARSRYDYSGERPLRLLVLGGSLGAAPINEIIPGTIRRLQSVGGSFEVWHQTGEAHLKELQNRYAYRPSDAITMEAFIEDMASAYRWADLVLCRAGALTISELAIMGRPAILVPLPQAIDDHQTVNARTLVREGAAVKVLQTEFDAYLLSALLKEYKSRPDRLKAMSDAAYRCARPDATAAVCDHCEELIHGD